MCLWGGGGLVGALQLNLCDCSCVWMSLGVSVQVSLRVCIYHFVCGHIFYVRVHVCMFVMVCVPP